MFAKLIGGNEPTSLPVLNGIQSKNKVIKGPTTNQFPFSMPTNLSTLIATDGASNQADAPSALPGNVSTDLNANVATNPNWVQCNDVPITFRSQLPLLPYGRNTKANMARQVTNVIKRHSAQLTTDKII